MPEIISRAEAIDRGLKRYFTGEPCNHGHICERLVSSKGMCVKCSWMKSEDYRHRNPKKTRRATDRSHAKNPKYRVAFGVGSKRACKICGEEFVKCYPNQVVCSDVCSQQNESILKAESKKRKRAKPEAATPVARNR